MKILILGKDHSLLPSEKENHIGDSLERHILYAEKLRQKKPNSEIKIITYSKKNQPRCLRPHEGLEIFGTSSKHRSLYTLDLTIILIRLFLTKWRPDLITVQTPWEEGLIGLVFSKIFCIKFLPQLHFDLFSKDWQKESPFNFFRKRIALIAFKYADKIRVVSEPLKKKLTEKINVSPQKITVAPVAVNFSPSKEKKEDCQKKIFGQFLISYNSQIVLFVGRLVPAKNLSLFVEVAKQINIVLPHVIFAIAGSGPEEKTIRSKISRLKLEHNFIFLGSIPHSMTPTLYAASDIFLLTSHYEGFGRVVLEAMLSGIPVVSTKCTGPEELIDHEKTGFLFPKNDPTALANATINLLKSPDEKQKIGTAAREKVKIAYSPEFLANKIIDTWIDI